VKHKIERIDCIGRAIDKCGVGDDAVTESCRRQHIKQCNAKHSVRYTKKNFHRLLKQVIRKCACDTRVTKKCTTSADTTTCITTEKETCVNRCNIRRKFLKDKLRQHITKKSGCKDAAATQCGLDNSCQESYIATCKSKVTERREYLGTVLDQCSGAMVHPTN